MLAHLGAVLSLGGATAALLGLVLLRRERCPACRAVGSLAQIGFAVDDFPAGRPSSSRTLRCGACAATVEERLSSNPMPNLSMRPAREPRRRRVVA